MSKASSEFTRIAVLILACAALALLSACGSDDESSGDSAGGPSTADTDTVKPTGDAPKGEPVKFGALTGVTGDYAPFTKAGLAGAKVAIDEINSNGGVLGRPVELVVADHKSRVEGAVAGFDRLVEVENVTAIGNVESDAGVAILDASTERQVPVMCPACGSTELDQIGEYMWRLAASDTDGGLALAQYAQDNDLSKIAMLVQQTEGPLSTAENFARFFEEGVGGEVCEDVRFDPGRSSYQAEVQRAWSCDPEAVYLSMGFEAAVPIIQEWQRRGLGGKLLLSPDLINEEVAEVLEGVAEGDAVGVGPGFDEESPAYKSFAKRYEEATGTEPSEALWEPVMYDQYIVLALAATAAGEVSGPAIAENVLKVTNPEGETVYSYADGVAALKAGDEIDFHGAGSSTDLTENGSLKAPVFNIIEPVDGSFEVTENIELDPSLK